jgi:hypothetical protein
MQLIMVSMQNAQSTAVEDNYQMMTGPLILSASIHAQAEKQTMVC